MNVLALLPLLSIAFLTAQEADPPGSGEIFVSADLEAERHLRRARDAEEEGEWEKAARLYDQLLGHPRAREALYDAGEGWYRSVREAVRQRLLALPPAGLSAYRHRVDPDARAALEEARRRGDPKGARLVGERYPASSIVDEALSWSAARAFDLGLYSDAAWAISRRLEGGGPGGEGRVGLLAQLAVCFLRSGDRAGALAIRDRVREAGGGHVRIAAEPVDAVGFLDGLLGAAPGGEAPGDDSSLSLIWAHRISDHYRKGEGDPPPFVHAVTTADDVFFHDGNHAYRLERTTGRLRWKVYLHPGGFSYRLPERECHVVVGGGAVFASPRGETLIALDRESGAILWRADGKAIRDALQIGFPVRISASLAHYGNRLFAAVTSTHSEAEVLVIALDAATGEPLWSVSVASRPMAEDRGATIIHEGPRIYLLSDIGVAAALDLPEGTIRWVRARGASRRRPSAIASGPILNLLFPGSGPRLELDAWTGRIRGQAPAGAADELLGFVGGDLCARGRGGLYVLAGDSSRSLWTSSEEARARCAIRGDHLFVPGPSGLVRIEKDGVSRPVAAWGEGMPGNLSGAGDIVISAASAGLFAYGVRARGAAPLDDDLPVPDLVRRLGEPDWEVRAEADRRLREMEPDAIPEIRDGERSDLAEVRWRAEEIIYSIDRRARMAEWSRKLPPLLLEKEPELLSQLTHRDPEIRRDGLDLLASEGGPEIAFLLRDLLGDRDSRIRLGAARGLLYLGDRTGFPLVEEGLGSESPEERRWALETLEEFGEEGDAGVIEPLLADPEPRVRIAALRAYVARLGRAAERKVRETLLDDPEDWIRLEVVRTAHQKWGGIALDLLRAAIDDESEAVRMEAILGLEPFFTREIADVFAAALMDDSRRISERVAETLHRQAQKGRAHLIPTALLEEALRSDDENLRYSVVQILEKMHLGSVVPGLVIAAADENPEIRERALGALGAIAREGRIPEDRIPAIARLLDLESAGARSQVLTILLRSRSPAANEAFIRALGDLDEQVRSLAEKALTVRADSRTVVRLLAVSVDEESPARVEAGRTLRLLPSHRLVPGLLDALEDDSLPVRKEAFRILGGMSEDDMGYDPAAEDRLEAVRHWRSWWHLRQNPDLSLRGIARDLSDPSPRVRHRAAKAAAKVQDDEVIGAVIEAIEGEKVRWVADAMIETLRASTGKEFGYAPKGPEEDRRAAIDRWIEWWKKK